jgi:hypothetical protein
LQTFDFEDHIGSDVSFMIEHGVCECLYDDGADFSWYSEADFMSGIEGLVIKYGLMSAGQFQVMSDKLFGLFDSEGMHVVTHVDTLIEGFHDGKFHGPPEIALPCQDQDEGVVGIHFEIGQQPEFFKRAGFQEMGFVNNEDNGFSDFFPGLQDGLLNLLVDQAFGDSPFKPQKPVDVAEKIGTAECGQGCIECFEEVFIEIFDKTSQGEGFSYAGISGEEEDTAPPFDIVEPGEAFLEGIGIHGLPGFDVFVKRESLESEPGRHIFHGTTLLS